MPTTTTAGTTYSSITRLALCFHQLARWIILATSTMEQKVLHSLGSWCNGFLCELDITNFSNNTIVTVIDGFCAFLL